MIALGRLQNLESLSLVSFDCITDVSICRLVPELVKLQSLFLRDNSHLTIRTLDACVQAAASNPLRQLSVHMDEKQLSASQLLVKYATSYLRHAWQRRTHPPLIDSCANHASAQEKEEDGQVCRQQQQVHRRWPPNLNVVIDENLR